jgi:hypothetical protein
LLAHVERIFKARDEPTDEFWLSSSNRTGAGHTRDQPSPFLFISATSFAFSYQVP